ncbi:MAG: lactate dehydrogenase, partial [Finegoldia magna]|nr:lactate dehydrogenase [Finegoldia magna]
IDMIELMLKISLNETVLIPNKKKKGSSIRYFNINPGRVKSILRLDDAKKLPGIVEIEICVKEGDNISEIKNSRDRIGHVIAEGENENEAIANAERAINMIKIEVENEK